MRIPKNMQNSPQIILWKDFMKTHPTWIQIDRNAVRFWIALKETGDPESKKYTNETVAKLGKEELDRYFQPLAFLGRQLSVIGETGYEVMVSPLGLFNKSAIYIFEAPPGTPPNDKINPKFDNLVGGYLWGFKQLKDFFEKGTF